MGFDMFNVSKFFGKNSINGTHSKNTTNEMPGSINLLTDFPYEGSPHMVLGDLHLRRQEPVQAMIAYKNAIKLNPDYLDKKTPVFQGKKIKNKEKKELEMFSHSLEQIKKVFSEGKFDEFNEAIINFYDQYL